MQTINLAEAKAHLGQYLQAIKSGERVIISERNQPIAELKLLPEASPRKKRIPGMLKDQFVVPEDFNSPLPEFEADFYGE
ncbi:type II toxin-antitoxin system prevent-host-death family antitoxin [Leptospira langatensis]|uniref:Antitoxin n=1 Tax=Leptospira langatensis TaxID=2484983 RepID=A0A5F1ZSI3_9LEPT|nr:type II toxin-antitoxin system prevent-host-death family antitoxin [Leptospira langatensis]TGK00226.1 type II toxin-antitoxin system prevent-host-death family antitoxin [Leptospira langatensis]TGL41140.1 type II toxin-antitoxin system prevent-host-death family antitoxin [Leptospira langatensis]